MNLIDAPKTIYWGFWDGVGVPICWHQVNNKELVVEYASKVWRTARDKLARRSPDRSNAYESLLKLRLADIKRVLQENTDASGNMVPLEVLAEKEIDFWFITIAQLILLGALAEDDYNGFLLVDN